MVLSCRGAKSAKYVFFFLFHTNHNYFFTLISLTQNCIRYWLLHDVECTPFQLLSNFCMQKLNDRYLDNIENRLFEKR